MSRRVKKEGFILKEGGHVYARSQRRYFVLEGRALTYYDGPSRSKEHGSIDLAPERCEVRDELPVELGRAARVAAALERGERGGRYGLPVGCEDARRVPVQTLL